MLSFKKPEISDKLWVNACLKHANSMNCEYTFGNLFIWSEAYKTEICKYKDFLIVRWHDGESLTYSVPLGEGDFTDAVEKIVDDARANNTTPKIYGVTEGYLGMLQEAFFAKFEYNFDDAFNDYIYSVEKRGRTFLNLYKRYITYNIYYVYLKIIVTI